MGKDREGNFHPKKGRPSGLKDDTYGLSGSTPIEALVQNPEVSDKYVDDEQIPKDDIHVLHPNRNTDKKRNHKTKETTGNESDKTINDKFTEEYSKTTPEELSPVSKEQLRELVEFQGNVCISIYLPTHQKGVEVNQKQDLIAFKNSLQDVEKILHDRKVDELEIKKMLKPGYDLLRDEDSFWNDLSQGLAIFISDNFFRYLKTDFVPAQEVLVNSSFLLAPLLESKTDDKYFYLLVMSKKQAKFYRGTQKGLERIEVPELPNGVDDVVHNEEKVGQQLFRTGDSGKMNGASFHGMGSGMPDDKKNTMLYLEEVDDTLWDAELHDKSAPLLLAGIEWMIPVYREVCDYSYVWPEAIVRGALEHESDAKLFEMAMEKMQPYFEQPKERALKEYYNQSATDIATTVPTRVIPAAYYARVKYLFVQRNAHIWGKFNEAENKVYMHAEQKNNDDCLLNNAAMQTLLNGGQVFFLNKEEMPDGSTIAAVLRY